MTLTDRTLYALAWITVPVAVAVAFVFAVETHWWLAGTFAFAATVAGVGAREIRLEAEHDDIERVRAGINAARDNPERAKHLTDLITVEGFSESEAALIIAECPGCQDEDDNQPNKTQ